MPLKNTNTLPPGGWVYEQKDNDGKVVKRFKSMSPFKEACMEILKCREANKFNRATLPQVMEDVDEAQCIRLGYDQNFVKKKAVTFTPAKLFSPVHLREGVRRVADTLGGLSNGARILLRWLGEGSKPVAPEIAQARAEVCLHVAEGKPCPFNQNGFKPVERIAELIRDQTEQKNELKLSVQGEEGLHTCALCFCSLPLKVHVPIEQILSGTPAPMLEKFKREQPKCWMVTEAENRNPANK